jgi:hypothetical protein
MSKVLIKAISAGNTNVIIQTILDAQQTGGAMGHRQLLQERNTLGESPLICAIKKKYMYVAEVLIGLDNNLNYAVPNTGDTAMMYAAKLGNETIVGNLIDAGADINIRNNAGQTASDIANDYDNPNAAPDNILQLRALTQLLNVQNLNAGDNVFPQDDEDEKVAPLNNNAASNTIDIPNNAFLDINDLNTHLSGNVPTFEDS